MILAIDIGNTNVVVGGIDKTKQVRFFERLSTVRTKTEMEYAIDIKNILDIYQVDPMQLEGGIISSVVPQITMILRKAAEKILGREVLVVGPGVKNGINIRMDAPSTVGSDLIVCAVAVAEEYPVPAIILDMGTATTLSVVDKDKNYIGGAIIPGVISSLESLTSKASQLYGISLEAPKKAISKNTINCMQSGIIFGNAALIDGMIDRFNEELGGEAFVVGTGGLVEVINPHMKKQIVIDDDLLLKGLRIIYDKNQ